MTGFNYLHDAQPEVLDHIQRFRLPKYLTTPVYVAATAACVIVAVTALLHLRCAAAQSDVESAQARFDTSKAALSQAKLARTDVEALLKLDGRLREIRSSGTALAVRLANIANHVPKHAWLSSIANAPNGYEVDGEAEGLAGLGDTIDGFIASRAVTHPRLVHAAIEDRSHGVGILAFEVQLDSVAQ